METEAQKPPEYFHVKVETADEENPPEYSAMSSEKQTSPLETLVWTKVYFYVKWSDVQISRAFV